MMAAKRVYILYIVLATVAGVAFGAWVAGSRIESPAEVAARTAAPTPSPILVPVEKRTLSSDIVTRGTVRFGLPQPISIAPSPLKISAGLVATLPVRNTQFEEGDVILSASGRPVFVLRGQVLAYRDLVPGTNGDDVRQLEQALERLGFDPGPVDGAYDQQTSAAVAQWYKAKGWEPFGPTRDQLANIRTLEREWGDAMRAKMAAQTAVATAMQGVAAARATAEQSNIAAALESAARADDRRKLIKVQGSGGSLSVENERAKADYADASAAADIEAQIADRALIVLDPRQPETARLAADAKLELARAARRKTTLEGRLAVQAAEREAMLAEERIKLAEAAVRAARLEGQKAVQAALDAQRLAEFDLKMTTGRADQLATDLGLARHKLGFQVPADEVIFIRNFPVRVEEVTAVVGGAATGPIMSVTDNQLAIDSSLPLDAAPLVKPGMRVAIDEQALGIKASGRVETVAGSPGTRGVDGFHIYFEVRVDNTPIQLQGFSVRLTIPIESTKGAVTAVPISAVSLAADGTSRVQVEKNGVLEYIAVEPALSAGGYVEVTPVEGELVPGQLVVVGYKNPESKDLK
jgi:peptidoglycan hydrolase-like protein with peptidoglycan-binding domain